MPPTTHQPVLTVSSEGPTACVITIGEHTDYQILRVFTDPVEAGTFVVRHNARPDNPRARVEEWLITETAPAQISWWRVRWNRDTDTIDPPEELAQWDDELPLVTCDCYAWRTPTGDVLVLSVDRDRAVTALAEELARIRRLEAGAA